MPDKKKSYAEFLLLYIYPLLDQKLEMTVPVTTKIDHRNGDLYSYEMCFFIPQEFQRNPPRPTNKRVRIVSFPELHVYSQ